MFPWWGQLGRRLDEWESGVPAEAAVNVSWVGRDSVEVMVGTTRTGPKGERELVASGQTFHPV